MSFCEYTTQKELRIRSVPLGSLKWIISTGVLLYMCIILVTEQRYQKKDSVISSVHTKVKGVLDADSRIWDSAEYTVPSIGSSFFVVTNIIKTESQTLGQCPEFPSPKTICSRDDICKKGHADPQSNGIQTGKCIPYNSTIKTCEIKAWCPVESKSTPNPALLQSAENLTVLIKNNIHFPAFNYTTFARYYKTQDQKELRTLIKAYGIRFDIQVYGIGGQFCWFELIIFIGSYLSYFGLSAVLIDLLITMYCKGCCNAQSGQRYYLEQKYEEISGPNILTSCLELKVVSFVDQDDIIMVDKKLNKCLQETKGRRLQREKFTDNVVIRQQDVSVATGLELLPHASRATDKPSDSVSWCRCGKCVQEKRPENKLCCRYKHGECITNSEMFNKLVLCRQTLIYLLQYSNPLLNIQTISSKQLIMCAEKEYIRWRFGSNKDVMDFAKIPSCCKNEIKKVFDRSTCETSFHNVDACGKPESSTAALKSPLLK